MTTFRAVLAATFLPAICFLGAASSTLAEPPPRILGSMRASASQTTGEISVAGLRESVEVLRDGYGVAHIYAKNQDDLFFAQGFVAAQDRLFQMEIWRRQAAGGLAAILGPSALPHDRFARLIRYRGDMDAEWASYGPDTLAICTAFTRGINAYIDQAKIPPLEFDLLGFSPRKWSPEDCLGRMAGIVMTRNFRLELARAELIQAVGLEKAARLLPAKNQQPTPAPGLDLAGLDRTLLADYDLAARGARFSSKSAGDGDSGDGYGAGDGSNNWVVDGTLSASGRPLLAGDPHRPIPLPSLRYLVHLVAPGINVIGAGEPALPGIALGHNERIAWTFTIVGTDQSDILVLDLDENLTYPDAAAGDGQRTRLETQTAEIYVKGQVEPVRVEQHFTRFGPVLHLDAAKRRAIVLHWVGNEPGGAAYLGGLAIGRAQNWQEFRAAMPRWKMPGENMMYADVDGHIGWFAAGATPVRRSGQGLLPAPLAASGQGPWERHLSNDELPQISDPPGHWLATANHDIVPAGYTREIGYEFSAPYRYERIHQQLAAGAKAGRKFDAAEFQRLQHDNVTIPGQTLARLAKGLSSPAFRDPRLALLAEEFAAWDGDLTRASRAGALYAVWLDELLPAFFRPLVPEKQLPIVAHHNNVPLLLAALEQPTAEWFGPAPVAARDALLRETFAQAAGQVRARLGDDAGKWTYGRLHTVEFTHPLATLDPGYGLLNLAKAPQAGDGFTPNATRSDANYRQVSGASYRQIFDVGDWDAGLVTSTPGQSGQPGSQHYGDLYELWKADHYFPLVYSRAKVEQAAKARLELKPGK